MSYTITHYQEKNRKQRNNTQVKSEQQQAAELMELVMMSTVIAPSCCITTELLIQPLWSLCVCVDNKLKGLSHVLLPCGGWNVLQTNPFHVFLSAPEPKIIQ